MSVFKAQATMRELVQRLQLIMPAATITTTYNSATDTLTQPVPTLTSPPGTPSIAVIYNAEYALAEILLDTNAGRVDGLNLPQQVYSPHIAELIQDSDQTSAAAATLKAIMQYSLAKLGMKVIIATNTQANIIAALTLNGGTQLPGSGFDTLFGTSTILLTLRSDEINPLIQSQ
jgi:hypothetical protein